MVLTFERFRAHRADVFSFVAVRQFVFSERARVVEVFAADGAGHAPHAARAAPALRRAPLAPGFVSAWSQTAGRWHARRVGGRGFGCCRLLLLLLLGIAFTTTCKQKRLFL